MKINAILKVCVVLAGVVALLSQNAAKAESVQLDRRYVDTVNGFSLRPPAGVERKKGFSASHLVTWQKRDKDTGVIVWTLSIVRALAGRKDIDLKPYSEALAEKLYREERFKVQSTKLTKVAGKEAIDFRGQTSGIILWQRQVWILRSEGEFLVTVISGPATKKDRLDKICEKVLGTLQLTDSEKAEEIHRKNLQRGQEFLASLNDKKFAAALKPKPQWFLLKLKGEDIGFRAVIERARSRDDVDGYEIKMWVMIKLPKQPVRRLTRVMFVTPNQATERWVRRLRSGTGPETQVVGEEGIRQNEMIVMTVVSGGRSRAFKKKVPEKIYLAQATGMLLPRLIDLKKPAGYAFAVYNPQANNFDMRTFTVIGPERISFGGRTIDVIRATDKPAVGDEPANLWIGPAGTLFRMTTDDGLVMEQSTESAIKRRFPEAVKALKLPAD